MRLVNFKSEDTSLLVRIQFSKNSIGYLKLWQMAKHLGKIFQQVIFMEVCINFTHTYNIHTTRNYIAIHHIFKEVFF